MYGSYTHACCQSIEKSPGNVQPVDGDGLHPEEQQLKTAASPTATETGLTEVEGELHEEVLPPVEDEL